MIFKVYWRIFNNFLMPSRLAELEQLYIDFQRSGYKFLPLIDALNNVDSLPAKFVFLRHDIDSDVRTARKIFELEKKHQITGSWYFRLSTVDLKLMQEIYESGAEVGYHYEEIGVLAKRLGIRSKDELKPHLEKAAGMFLDNLHSLRERAGLPIPTVASHGDFANRALKLRNSFLLENQELRRKGGVLLEAYDKQVEGIIQGRFSDKPLPVAWWPHHPSKEPVQARLLLLIHPRQWESHAIENFKLDMSRLLEGVCYYLLSAWKKIVHSL